VPKLNDTDDELHQDKVLRFSENVDCPKCGTLFEGNWIADVIDVEQIAGVEDFVGDQTCPKCGHVFHEDYTGWHNYSDAGDAGLTYVVVAGMVSLLCLSIFPLPHL
jgi:uncharacterized C2H2 Zn-finger protein